MRGVAGTDPITLAACECPSLKMISDVKDSRPGKGTQRIEGGFELPPLVKRAYPVRRVIALSGLYSSHAPFPPFSVLPPLPDFSALRHCPPSACGRTHCIQIWSGLLHAVDRGQGIREVNGEVDTRRQADADSGE